MLRSIKGYKNHSYLKRVSNFNIKKSAFTLAEVLITLAIIGVVVALTVGLVRKYAPDKLDINHKKATHLIEQLVHELAYNELVYPKTQIYSKQGFKNTDRILYKGTEYGGDWDDASPSNVTKKREKFCKLFSINFEKIPSGEILCEEQTETVIPTIKSFTSTDNFDWYIPANDFHDDYIIIMVDVNGSAGPNTTEGSVVDRFLYYIRSNGTVIPVEPTVTALENVYNIVVDQICSENGKVVDKVCGEINIAEITGVDEDGNYETVDLAKNFNNLKKNTRYLLTATPNDGYYSNWLDDNKIINTKNKKPTIRTSIRFTQTKSNCIKLRVNDCQESNILDCIGTSLSKYEYMQNGAVAGELLETYDMQEQDDSNILYVCGLYSGNYLLDVAGKTLTDYRYLVTNDGINGIEDYSQNLKLGTTDLIHTINLLKVATAPAVPPVPPENPPEPPAECGDNFTDPDYGNVVNLPHYGYYRDYYISDTGQSICCQNYYLTTLYNRPVEGYCSVDYWLSAKKACEARGMRLPDFETLKTIVDNAKSGLTGCKLSEKYWSSEETSAVRSLVYPAYNSNTNQLKRADFPFGALCIEGSPTSTISTPTNYLDICADYGYPEGSVTVPGVGCFVRLDHNYDPIDTCDDPTYDDTGTSNKYCHENYWAGAKKACADLGMEMVNDKFLSALFSGETNGYSVGAGTRARYWTTEHWYEEPWEAYNLNKDNGPGANDKNISTPAICVGKIKD